MRNPTNTGGELVWTRNDVTLEYGYRPVIATKATPDQPIFQVTVKNHQGDIETLETTAEHPFWIKDTGWLKASLLEQGMILLDRNNQEVEVLSQFLLPNHTNTVYNIEVDGFHTYHVGRLGVWVHNANCCDFIVGGDGTVASIKNMSQQEIIGIQRELNVTHITGGKLAKIINKNGHLEDMPIQSVDGRILTGIDVIGKNGKYISVGGPAKGSTPEKLAETLRKLQILKSEAEKNGTKAMVYYERGNSEKFQRLVEESKKILGKENVVIFDK